MVKSVEEVFDELRISIFLDSLTCLAHKIELILHIVNGEEMCTSYNISVVVNTRGVPVSLHAR